MDASLFYDFESIVRYGSISEAAKNLHITQPALSRRLNTIEQEIGLQLFERTTPIQLTPAGEVFLEYACRINAEYFKLKQHMTNLRDNPLSIIRVAGLYSPKIGGVLRRIKAQVEDEALFVDLKQETLISQHSTMDLLREGTIEVAIEPYSPELDDDGLVSTTLLHEPAYVLVAEDNPLAKKDEVSGSDLGKTRFVYSHSNRHYAFYRHLRWLCTMNGMVANSPRSILLSNASTARDIFLQGLGDYAIMCPQSMGELMLGMAGPGHTMRPFTGKENIYDIRAFYKETAAPEVLQFVDVLKDAFAE